MTLTIQRTPFNFLHKQIGARMVEFAGWEMPVQFESVMAEHRAVRERAGLFDISHMGQVWFTGSGARATLQNLVTNDVSSLPVRRGRYAFLCRDDGHVIDDLYVYCLDEERFLVIVNASRAPVDIPWMKERLGRETQLMEQPQAAALAVQGPAAAGLIGQLSSEALALSKNGVAELSVLDMEMVVARTGYTGEDGFELFGPAGHLFPVYEFLMKKGKAVGLVNAGLGARDTLRLEMGYCLYGHELDEDHSALESGLGWAVKLAKPSFVGRDALLKEKAAGSRRRLIGFRLRERGVPREKLDVHFNGKPVGTVTSGTFSPSLGIGIGMAYVENVLMPTAAESAAPFTVQIHGRAVPADIVPLPFYRKATPREV